MKRYHQIALVVFTTHFVLWLKHMNSPFQLSEKDNGESGYLAMSDKIFQNRIARYLTEIGYDIQTDHNIYSMVNKLRSLDKDFFPKSFWTLSIEDLLKQLTANRQKTAARLPFFTGTNGNVSKPNWYKFHSNIRQYSLYDTDDPAVDGLLHDMTTLPITYISENTAGTQLKMVVTLQDGGRALLKPMRYSRNGSAYDKVQEYFERHFAEIATFHLDRILGFYRVPPAVGRRVNTVTELKHLAPPSIRRTMFTDNDGNVCFYGECSQGCSKRSAFCGTPDSLEAALIHYLPTPPTARLTEVTSPWRRTLKGEDIPEWMSFEYMCNKTRQEFDAGDAFLADSLDVLYFDMFIDNTDRHGVALFEDFGNQTAPIMLDNGRGFGNPDHDHHLARRTSKGIRCCLIKKSTFLRYLKVFLGPDKLSSLMRTSLQSDPVSPVLIESQLAALDRRLGLIIIFIAECLQTFPLNDVILNDID